MTSKQVSDHQATLVAALSDPTRYSHPVADVEHLETHISHILLAGEYAYKIKKPLNLGFLDFTDLGRRKFFCAEEVRLNRRLAPDIYLDCIPINGSEANPVLNADPEDAVEYAVKMRRFLQDKLLDRCLAAGVLQPHHLDRLAHQLAEFHLTIARADLDTPFGTPEHVYQPARDNFTQTRPLLQNPEDLDTLDQLEVWTQTTYEALKLVLAERKTTGYIRECHGDLHLGNMLLQDESVVIFDCIEFNDDFRWIDVMNDLGFLLMDLHKRRAGPWAWRVLNTYLESTGDYAGLALLPYYQVYRAMVRAKIAAIRLHQPGLTESQHQVAAQECRAYLQLAVDFTAPPKPFLLITHGVSGSGKSFLTDPLREQLGAVRIRSDIERKRLFGLEPLASSHSNLNQGIYTLEASQRTYTHLRNLAASMLNAGYRVIVDATFLAFEQRQSFRALAEEKGVPFILLACSADVETLRQRVKQRQHRGEDAAEADGTVLERQLTRYQPPQPQEHPLYSHADAGDGLHQAILTRLGQTV